jgi:phosphatidylglycerophosphate synthase
MLDAAVRPRIARPLDGVARALDRPGVTPDRLTLVGLGLGLGAAVAAAQGWWWVALSLWLMSRAADGVDGALARRRSREPSPAGGFLDIAADFVVYGAFVVGVAVGAGGSLLPFLLVLLAYYINGSAFLAFSAAAERSSARLDDGRSLSFLGGLAEGTETVVVHSLWCLLPIWAGTIAWAWAVFVLASGVQRIVIGHRALREASAPA